MTAVVGPLGAIHQRPTLDGEAVSVCLHFGIGHNSAHRHRQVQFDGVARLPLAGDRQEAVEHRASRDDAAVHLDGQVRHVNVGTRLGIRITVEIAGHGLAPNPPRYSDVHGELRGPLGR